MTNSKIFLRISPFSEISVQKESQEITNSLATTSLHKHKTTKHVNNNEIQNEQYQPAKENIQFERI